MTKEKIMEQNKILSDDEQIELIKSKMFEGLEILNQLKVKKDKGFCDDCEKQWNLGVLRFYQGKKLCYNCWRSRTTIINTPINESVIDLSDVATLPKILIDNPKLPKILIDNPQYKFETDFEEIDLTNLTEKNLQRLITSKKQSETRLNKNEEVKLPNLSQEPAKIPTKIIKINLLDGLTDFQKQFVIEKVKQGYHPLGFTIYLKENEIYYFGDRVF
jgi:hypothetical protein